MKVHVNDELVADTTAKSSSEQNWSLCDKHLTDLSVSDWYGSFSGGSWELIEMTHYKDGTKYFFKKPVN